jgi:hypothetical protein
MNQFQGTEPTQEELALVAQGYAMRQVYWPAYTWQIQTKHLNKVDENRQALEANGVDIDLFNKHKSDLFNKINASFYHLEKLKENEGIVIGLGKKMAEESKKHLPDQVFGIVGTPYEPIEYEYEALLVTLKSALDVTAMILAQPSSLGSDNIVSLFNDSSQSKRPNTVLTALKELLAKDEHRKIIDEFKNKDGVHSKRNYAVHQGSLPTGTINIQFTAASTEIGILKTRTMEVGGDMADFSKQQSLDEYATELFYSVCDLAIEGLELLVGQSLPKGSRMSVYEERRAAKANQ